MIAASRTPIGVVRSISVRIWRMPSVDSGRAPAGVVRSSSSS
jgi:hypothetical protein